MKRELFLIILTVLMVWSCARQTNPFFSEFDTPFGVPPFEQIEENHYFPAFRNAVREQREEIARIIENAEAPTFANTIEALDYSGSMLRRVDETFNVLNGSMTNETMQKIDEKIAPLLSKHRDDILLNEDLFERVKAVYDARETLDLNEEQQMLLEKTYKGFVRGGVNLDEEKKRRLRELNEELSLLSIKFGQNILKENNRWEMVIEDEADLAGLPEPDCELEGYSFASLLDVPDQPWKTAVFSHDIEGKRRAVKTRRYDYIKDENGNNKELFDMIEDPGETTNIAGENPDIIAKMEELYNAGWRNAIPKNPITEPVRN